MIYVFDLDGTLIDSSKRHWMLMKKLLNNFGVTVPNSFSTDYLSYKSDGHNGKQYLIQVMGINENIADRIHKQWVEHIEDDEWLELDCLYDDAISTLNKIETEILLLTIRNNRDGVLRETARLGLNRYNLKIIVHGENKADVLKRLSDKCVMVGDTEVDYSAAIEASTEYYILNRGFRSRKYWQKKSVQSYDDLRCLINKY